MMRLTLILAAGALQCVQGKRVLPPLPVKDGCFHVDPELDVFRKEDDAIILHFPFLKSVLDTRRLTPPTPEIMINKLNGTKAVTYQGEGRVQQHDSQLWILSARPSDSGVYSCTLRNETFCITGSVTLHVFESTSVDMEQMSYPWSATVGERLLLVCPSLENFNTSHEQIEWFKDSSLAALQPDGTNGFSWEHDTLVIPYVKPIHAGLYTCQLTVNINEQRYKVSRAIQIQVQGSDADLLDSSSSSTTPTAPVLKPPVIVPPLDGTVLNTSRGSGLELLCLVNTDCETANSTLVRWFIGDRPLESSHLKKRTRHGERKINRGSPKCQIEVSLIVSELTAEDEGAHLECVVENIGERREDLTRVLVENPLWVWLSFSTVALFCFMVVLSIFLYVLYKLHRNHKTDYILARQSSSLYA